MPEKAVPKMKVVIIGSGNVATVLAKLVKEKGHELVQVAGRSLENLEMLATDTGAPYTNRLQRIDRSGQLYIIAVSDSAVPDICNELILQNKLVVHTAGSLPMNILKQVSTNHGVLYPLQSLRKEMKRIPLIPFCVDGNTADDRCLIADFASSLSPVVIDANDEKRMQLHLAAVVVNNFTNHLFTLAKKFCAASDLDFGLLYPLIEETALRIEAEDPSKLQTGPAVRNDENTISRHLALLQGHEELRLLYPALTQSIMNFYSAEK